MSTLLETLSGLDEQKIVFVGSDSAWFDVARAGEIRQWEYIQKLSRREKRKLVKAAKNAEAYLDKLLRNPPAWDGLVMGDTMENSIKKYLEKLSAHQKTISRAYNNVITRNRKVDSFVPLWDRQVREVYPRISDEGLCISLYGDEKGDYWFIEEKYPDGIPLFFADER